MFECVYICFFMCDAIVLGLIWHSYSSTAHISAVVICAATRVQTHKLCSSRSSDVTAGRFGEMNYCSCVSGVSMFVGPSLCCSSSSCGAHDRSYLMLSPQTLHFNSLEWPYRRPRLYCGSRLASRAHKRPRQFPHRCA